MNTDGKDHYDQQLDELERHIQLSAVRRDAQSEEHPLRIRAQQDATHYTAQWYELADAAPRLRELDAQIAALASRGRGLQLREDEKRATLSRTAVGAGAASAVGLLVGVAFAMGWLWWLVTLLCLVGAVAAGLQSTRMQLNPPHEMREHAQQQADLMAERKELLPWSEN